MTQPAAVYCSFGDFTTLPGEIERSGTVTQVHVIAAMMSRVLRDPEAETSGNRSGVQTSGYYL